MYRQLKLLVVSPIMYYLFSQKQKIIQGVVMLVRYLQNLATINSF